MLALRDFNGDYRECARPRTSASSDDGQVSRRRDVGSLPGGCRSRPSGLGCRIRLDGGGEASGLVLSGTDETDSRGVHRRELTAFFLSSRLSAGGAEDRRIGGARAKAAAA